MKKNDMRHHGRAENACRQENAFRTLKLWDHGMVADCTPVGVPHDHFDEVAERNNTDECGDDRFQRTKAIALQSKDDECDNGSQDTGGEQGDVKEQIKPERSAQKLGEIGCHGDDFH